MVFTFFKFLTVHCLGTRGEASWVPFEAAVWAPAGSAVVFSFAYTISRP